MATTTRATQIPVQEPDTPDEATGWPVVVTLQPVVDLSEDQFFEFCQINRDLRIERNAEGELLVMPPEGSHTGSRSAQITVQLGTWSNKDRTGIFFGSSTGFTLPDGAVRSPDASWMARSRWEQLAPEDRQVFAHICPDFVLELRSPTDRLRDLHDKMQEYIDTGARLGWLIDPKPRHVYVYRPDAPVERLDDPESISGDPVLPGFALDLREIW